MTDRRVTQTVQFLPRPSGGELYVVLTLPADAPPSRLALLCPPTFEEHGRSYVVLRELARRLAARGVGTLRFDYVGIGESWGEPDAFTMRAATADIAFLASWLTERHPGIPLVPVGVRFGARLMLDALGPKLQAGGSNLATPILWDPVLDAGEYILGELRITIAGAMVVYQSAVVSREDIVRETMEKGVCERGGFKLNQIEGYMVTRELLADAHVLDPKPWVYPGPVLVSVAISSGNGDRQKKAIGPRLPAMTFQPVHEPTYWSQPPSYDQSRATLFELTQQWVER
jgi:hypothetical protein